MGKYSVDLKENARKEISAIYKSGDKASIKKIERILIELSEHPQKGIGNPEMLKHSLSGFWSRRINRKDRIIYEIFEEPEKLVVVVSALGHY